MIVKPDKSRVAATWNELVGDALNGLDFSIDAGDVRAIIGVDSGSFQQWLARGLLDFQNVRSGKRTFRKFHISQIPRLVLISEIWKNGVLVGEAIHVADTILQRMSEGPLHQLPGVSVPAAARALRAEAELRPLILIFWFRQAGLVSFHRDGDNSARDLFIREGYASSIVIHVETLKARIREAAISAKRAHESRGGE